MSENGVCRVPDCGREAQSFGLCSPHYQKMWRGGGIGFWRDKRVWLDWEEEFVKQHLSRLGYERTAHALGRHPYAVKLRCKRFLGAGILSMDGGYTRNRLERMLGLAQKTLLGWHERGLPWREVAVVTGGEGHRGRVQLVMPDDVHVFLREHPEALDWTRLDRLTRHRFGLDDLAPRPRCKWVLCSEGHRNRVPLDGMHLCRRCGRRMTPWAEAYSDEAPEQLRPRAPVREQVAYYDAIRDRMQCLVCKQWFRVITASHVRTHGYDSLAAYFEAHGYDPRSPVANRVTGDKIRHNWGMTKGAYKRPRKPRTPCPPWRPAERERLRREYATADLQALAEAMGRPIGGLRAKAWQLGLRRERGRGIA